MIFQRKIKCAACGNDNHPDAKRCIHCGKPLPGGEIRCGACNTLNPSDGAYCMECGQPLSSSEVAMVNQNRWTAGDNDFAVRIEADDLPGLLKKGINVEAGTNAMLLENGANVGVVPPGSYLLSSFSQRFGDLFRAGLPKQLTILLTRIVPTDLDFLLSGIFTNDPLRIGMNVKVQVAVQDPAKFLINVLRGRERFSVEDLRQFLYPEVAAVADGWVRTHSVQELADDLSLREKFDLALDETLRRTFMQSGLRFLQVRAVEMNLEVIDRIKGIKSDYALQISETEATATGRKRLIESQHELNLVGLAEEVNKVELEERKFEVLARLRQATTADRMSEIKSENDFKAFLKENDRQEVLDQREQDLLLRTWKEEAEDHEKARSQVLAMLEIEQAHNRRLAELKSRTDLDRYQLDTEIELETKKLDYDLEKRHKILASELELDRERQRIESERFRLNLENEKLRSQQEREEDEADAAMGLKILANMKQISRLNEEEELRIRREDELLRTKSAMEVEAQRFEHEERQKAAEREHEIRKLDAISRLSSEQLISISPSDQGRIIADLKRNESFKDMSEEQILALMAEKNPQIALALQEKFRAVAEGRSTEKERELYERLLGDQKDLLEKFQQMTDKRITDVNEANRQSQETAKHAMDRLAETAKAFAEGGANRPVIVVGGDSRGGTQVINPVTGQATRSASTEVKHCVNCGREVDADAKHCSYCGHKFEGV